MAVPRLNIQPPQPATVAQLGFNAQSTFNTTALATLKASGATLVRFQPAWGSTAPNTGTESTSTPGTYSLGASVEAALAYCGANGIQPIAVCGFGPGFTRPLTLTVGAAGASIGDLTVPISSGNLASIQTPLDHVQDNTGHSITAKAAYYGGLIDSVNVGAGTITLASHLTVNLTSGQTILVSRILYASPADQLLTNPSMIAYFNYLTFVAGRIAANGCTGWVALWNEPPWGNDPWDARGKFYDSLPGGMNNDTRMKMFLQYILAGNVTLPAGVRIINGASDKSGGSGMVEQGLAPTATQVTNYVPAESVHPYHNLPEGSLWDRLYTKSGNSYLLLNQTVDSFANFQSQSFAQDAANVGLTMMATEFGTQEADDTRQAIYLLRRVISTWGCKTVPVSYSFSTNDGGNYGVTGSSFAPRLAYTALQSLMTIIAGLGGPGGSPANVPYVVGYRDQAWPLMGTGIYGGAKAVLFVWQRTGADQTTVWNTITTPATYSAQFAIPAGKTVQSVTDVLTGSAVSHTQSGSILTVSAISESPTAIIVA